MAGAPSLAFLTSTAELDIAVRTGTSVKAADGGTVTYAGWMGGYGYLVQIDHGNGYVTRYGHNSSLTVSVGQKVYKGQQIGPGRLHRATPPETTVTSRSATTAWPRTR